MQIRHQELKQNSPNYMKRLILSVIAFGLITMCVAGVVSQTKEAARTPTVNSPERKAILDALRADGSNKNVLYQVHFIRVHNGWAWVDTTPLDANTKQPTAEGGPNLLHMVNGQWKVMDLSKVPEDPNDPMGAEDASPTYVRNVRRTFKGCPADIFPKPSH
jgi:hypothetical protein